jgi:hypothetical protein
MMIRRFVLLVAAGCLVSPLPARAQTESGWKPQVILYFVGAGMSGETAIQGISRDVDASFGDIMENLDFGFMSAFRIQKRAWSVGTDIVYVGLGTTSEAGQIEVDSDQWMVELNGGYMIRPFFTVIAGGRYNSLSTRLFFPQFGNERKASQEWIDPLIGGRLDLRLGKEWMAHLRADVGGFGVGSDFAWQLVPGVEWMPSERLSALAGYRIISMDYENKDDGFKYDMTISGPALGLLCRF